MFLSIIVPSYNVEQYVEDCLKSCVAQNIRHDDYEIIVINDGSKDNTLDVINGFVSERQTHNIKVFSHDNQGLSATRNRGLSLAEGDYIWFVDSDDWMAENILDGLRLFVEKHNQPDVVVLNTIMKREGVAEEELVDRRLVQESCDGAFVYQNSYIYPYSGAQFYLFKRDYLLTHGLSFKPGIYFEDCLFTPSVLSQTDHCAYYSTPAYYYRLRANSITTSSITEKKLYDSITVAEELKAKMDDERTKYPNILKDAICRTYEVLFRYYILKSAPDVQKKFLKLLNSNDNWKSMKGISLKHKVYYYIMRVYALIKG